MRFASARILTSLFGYLDTIGVAPRDVADAASVAFIGKSSGAERIPARLAIEIRERCAVRLGEPLFGLEYAQALDPKTFGPISLFWRYAPSLRYSHRFSSRILHVHHEGVVVDLIVAGDEAALVYRMDPELRDGARQFVETNLSFALRICRWILGADWSPIRVAFAHEPIGPLGRYARILKAPVSFRAGEDALIFKAAELDRKSAGHDPELLAFVEGSLTAAAERVPLDFRERLDKTLEDLLAMRNPRLSAAATALGMSDRTLQRRLACEGLSFQGLLRDKRRRIVEEGFLGPKRPSLALLAERTGYSDASAASRFIRTQAPRFGRG